MKTFKLLVRLMYHYNPYIYFAVIVTLTLIGCSREFEYGVVSGPLQIPANTRVSIKNPEHIRTPNDYDSVCVLPAEPYVVADAVFGPNGVVPPKFVGPNGAAFSPKIFVRNASGIEDPLPSISIAVTNNGTWLCFRSLDNNQKLHLPYTEIALESSEAMYIKSIQWDSTEISF
ncbi:hypothetical protein JWZ98_22645 [Methylomonas sp. EFPC1]|uniref:hypothetical protein n=1 Tax=Methylomonas sp. EFPC1 TaxID=2812647 RepID=UPI0019682106|nr:hypothetical protein [Methylomonas sp. EFPC1]QSB01393.1 hypothetical protein JWZ98_22645 [Methylomonas sp. EFPC1]